MIIFFEGPDGSGKSTLLNNIDKQFDKYDTFKQLIIVSNANSDIPTRPNSDIKRLTEKELYSKLKYMATNKNVLYLVDRGPVSDFIYRIFDKFPTVTTIPTWSKFINKYGHSIMTIFCMSELSEAAMLKRGDNNKIAIQKHSEITKAYEMFISLCTQIHPYNWARYDFNKRGDFEATAYAIRHFCYCNMSNNSKRRQ